MTAKFKKGDLVRVYFEPPGPRFQGVDVPYSLRAGWLYGFIIDFPIDGKTWARLCVSDGTKTIVLTKDLKKPNEQP